MSSFCFYNANFPQNSFDEELKAVEKLFKNKNAVVQKAHKRNSAVLVDRDVYSIIWKIFSQTSLRKLI